MALEIELSVPGLGLESRIWHGPVENLCMHLAWLVCFYFDCICIPSSAMVGEQNGAPLPMHASAMVGMWCASLLATDLSSLGALWK